MGRIPQATGVEDHLLRWHVYPGSPPQRTITSSGCGHLSKENRETQVPFACVECGVSENADLVAAINKLSPLMRLRRHSLRPETCFESPRCVLILARPGWQAKVERILMPMCPFFSLNSTAAVY
jgi:Putative transposase DNA-binding domain